MLARTTTWGCPVSSSIWPLEQPAPWYSSSSSCGVSGTGTGNPHRDVTTSGPPGHRVPVQHLTDLFVPVQAVDQRDGRGDGGAAAAALPDRHSVGMPGAQHDMDPGIQLGGHVLGAPLGVDVELAQRFDRHLGS